MTAPRTVTVKLGELELHLAWAPIAAADCEDWNRLAGADVADWQDRFPEMSSVLERIVLKLAHTHHPGLTLDQVRDNFLAPDLPGVMRAVEELVAEARAEIAIKEAKWPGMN